MPNSSPINESLDDGRVTFRDNSARDPVCGAPVDTRDKRSLTAEHEGTTYHFCSDACRKRFQNNPNEFAVDV